MHSTILYPPLPLLHPITAIPLHLLPLLPYLLSFLLSFLPFPSSFFLHFSPSFSLCLYLTLPPSYTTLLHFPNFPPPSSPSIFSFSSSPFVFSSPFPFPPSLLPPPLLPSPLPPFSHSPILPLSSLSFFPLPPSPLPPSPLPPSPLFSISTSFMFYLFFSFLFTFSPSSFFYPRVRRTSRMRPRSGSLQLLT